jgi:small subunit ribosomal protein S20
VPNIKQQEKRDRLSTRQRLRNRQVKSSLRTLFKKLDASVAEGDRETATQLLRTLTKRIDQAASKGVIHKNAAARAKSRAAHRLQQLD